GVDRCASRMTLGVLAYNLFLSRTHLHSNRAYLVIVLAGLAAAPCGRELSVDAWLRARRGGRGAGRGPRLPRPGVAAVAPAVRGVRGLRRVRAEQAGRRRLVRGHRHLAPDRPGARPARRLAAARLGGLTARRPPVPHRGGPGGWAHRGGSPR